MPSSFQGMKPQLVISSMSPKFHVSLLSRDQWVVGWGKMKLKLTQSSWSWNSGRVWQLPKIMAYLRWLHKLRSDQNSGLPKLLWWLHTLRSLEGLVVGFRILTNKKMRPPLALIFRFFSKIVIIATQKKRGPP